MVIGALLDHGIDQVLWDSAETEATNEKCISILDVFNCFLGTWEDLTAEAPHAGEGAQAILE